MKKFFIGVVAMAATLLVGCGQSFYPTKNHNLVTTNVNISEANFRVVGLVEGQAKATYVLGIGGLSGKALRANAYTDMVRNANLKGSQMIVNATINQTIYGFAPFRWTEVVKYQGTVIEFINPNHPVPSSYSEGPKAITSTKQQVVAEQTPKAEKKSVKNVATKPLEKSVANKINSMSKKKRETYLTNLVLSLNRLCADVEKNPHNLEKNSKEIDQKMAEYQYILNSFDCQSNFYTQFEKISAVLKK